MGIRKGFLGILFHSCVLRPSLLAMHISIIGALLVEASIGATSQKAVAAFDVKVVPNSDPMSYSAGDILITFKRSDSVYKGLMVTIVNPLQVHGNEETPIREPSDSIVTSDEAKQICENLDYAGMTGWRLPTKLELDELQGNDFTHISLRDRMVPNRGRLWFAESRVIDYEKPDGFYGHKFQDFTVYDLFNTGSKSVGEQRIFWRTRAPGEDWVYKTENVAGFLCVKSDTQ